MHMLPATISCAQDIRRFKCVVARKGVPKLWDTKWRANVCAFPVVKQKLKTPVDTADLDMAEVFP
jgi:hypothetical protein